MIGSRRAILFARSMCSSMRWNSATSGSMASTRQRLAGPRIILRRCSSFTSTAISTEIAVDVKLEHRRRMIRGPASRCRPAYHPSPMLKLYIYGYLNRVQSSRRLEREAGRNLEVMWLTGRLAPDHKTIADFRKDNGAAIKKVCAQFVELCRKMGLLTKASVAIDGSKFKAVNSRDNNFTQGKIQRRQKQIEESVARYMSQLDTADRQTAAGEEPSETVLLTKTRLREKLAKLEEEVKTAGSD